VDDFILVQRAPRSIPLPSASSGPFPLAASSNGRYLVNAQGQPFYLQCISAQGMSQQSVADVTTFLSTMSSLGFNAVQWDLAPGAGGYVTSGGGTISYNNYGTLDGLYAFVGNGFIPSPFNGNSSVNAAYWSRMDTFVQLCATYGMWCILNPMQTGSEGNFEGFATADCTAYTAWVANRYKSYKHVAYQFGNDYGGSFDAQVAAMMLGVQETAPAGTLITMEMNYGPDSTALDDANFRSYVNWTGNYSYYVTFWYGLVSYLQSPAAFAGVTGTNKTPTPCPSTLLEANYEYENNVGNPGNRLNLRQQAWWTLCSGVFGQQYGNGFLSTGFEVSAGSNIQVAGYTNTSPLWKNNMATPGVADLTVQRSFLSTIAWQNLVPDNAHTVGTAGYGSNPTAATGFAATNYITVSATPDGTLALAYFIYGQTGTLTVAMSHFAGSVTARWLDPTNGAFTAISGSPFSNTGTHNFVPTSNNANGDPDWVLVLTAP
jgi:hypothetical protein